LFLSDFLSAFKWSVCLHFSFLWLHLYVRFSCISPFGEMIYLLSTLSLMYYIAMKFYPCIVLLKFYAIRFVLREIWPIFISIFQIIVTLLIYETA